MNIRVSILSIKTNIGLVLTVLLFNVQCRKDECTKYYWGNINALKNGTAWTADIRAGNDSRVAGKIYIMIDKINSDCLFEEGLSFGNIPPTQGKYRLFRNNLSSQDPNKAYSYFSTLIGGDAICDWYDVIEADSVNNFIQINSFDAGSGKVSGIFSVKLAVKLPKCDPLAPDTLLFSNGVFNTKVFN